MRANDVIWKCHFGSATILLKSDPAKGPATSVAAKTRARHLSTIWHSTQQPYTLSREALSPFHQTPFAKEQGMLLSHACRMRCHLYKPQIEELLYRRPAGPRIPFLVFQVHPSNSELCAPSIRAKADPCV